MPKDTFFNLSEKKRNKIIQAAKNEFTEHELFKSRVSNIIANAEIPRGSFYQYFEDLEDLYYYVIDDLFDTIYTEGNRFTQDTSDLFEFAANSFEYDYDAYKNDKRHQFMMNVLKSISNNEDYVQDYNKRRTDYIMSILNKMDLSNIKFSTKEELVKMYIMIQDIKRSVINKAMIDQLSKEEAIKEVKWYLDIIKNGLLKDEQ